MQGGARWSSAFLFGLRVTELGRGGEQAAVEDEARKRRKGRVGCWLE
jgi:hypothetical protein